MSAVRYPIPTSVAAMDLARHHAIEASAGTGKTYLIEHRVVDLIVRGGAAIEDILVVTFTEKATAELRARVRRLIERVRDAEPTELPAELDDEAPAWVIDEAARKALDEAAFGFDRAPIFTIHGFCHRVLGDNAFGSGRLFEQTQVASETAFAAAFKAVLREELAREPEDQRYLEQWLGDGGKRLAGLQQLLFRCSEQRGALTPTFDGEVLWRAAQALHGASIELDTVLATLKQQKVHHSTVKSIGNHLGALLAMVELAPDALALVGALHTAAKGFHEQLDKLIGCALEPVSSLVSDVLDAAAPLEAVLAQRFLPRIQARLARDKHARGELDFQDMLELVWAGLRGADGPGLTARLRSRYRHALIDEFQDTDELQWNIFRHLFLDSAGTNWLSIIGDPKQAIYSFRGADVFTYLEARTEMLARGAQETTLSANYRSTAALVDAYNLVFEHRLDDFFDGGIRYDHPVTAGASIVAEDAAGNPVTPIDVVQVAGSADTMRTSHARFIADEIRAMVEQQTLRIGPPGQTRPVEARDIYVLTRSIREGNEMAAALRRAGVACALYKQEGLFRTAEAEEVRDLLHGISDPRSPAARFSAWKTRFFAPALSELPALRELPETHPLLARLYAWKALADRTEYEELFASILADSGLIERELFVETSERALTNFLHLFELLLEEVTRSRCDLPDLVVRLQQWIDDFEENSGDVRNIQRLETERSAVQIMTVHKAKGLEAPVVFLFGGYKGGGGGEIGVYHDGDERKVYVGRARRPARIEEESAWEDQRLVYVALTRAMAKLYLPLVPRAKGAMIDRLNQRLTAITGRLGTGTEPRVDSGFRLRELAPEPSAAMPPLRIVPPLWSPPAALLSSPPVDPGYERTCRQRAGHVVTSYTRLKGRDDGAVPVDIQEFKADLDDAAITLPEHHRPGGAASGIFLHDALEHLPFASAAAAADRDAWRARPEIDRTLRETMSWHAIDPRHAAHAERLLYGALTTPAAAGEHTLPPLAEVARPLREVEFLYPSPNGAVLVKGFIDLIFEHDGRAYVLDWKSDVLPSYGAESIAAHVAASYQLQAQLYSLALIKMLGIRTEAEHEARFGGVLYWFLRGAREDARADGVHFQRPGLAELESVWRTLGDWC
ncbi:MAG TPA: UvrD-helicase domain-containing protein [Kofleriaceae bacterium]|nr:UvrD-helicase domain-containing protein [Kofleriaceae bacterium]